MDVDISSIPPVRKYPGGRPVGSRNYSGSSVIAREMKMKGIRWVDEFIDSYSIYKQQLKDGKTPDPKLLEFWMVVLPYITVKMIEKETRGQRPKYKYKPRVSKHAIEKLAQMEGRKV